MGFFFVFRDFVNSNTGNISFFTESFKELYAFNSASVVFNKGK